MIVVKGKETLQVCVILLDRLVEAHLTSPAENSFHLVRSVNKDEEFPFSGGITFPIQAR